MIFENFSHVEVKNIVNPLYMGNPLTETFTNSEDPDEMLHYVAFNQGLHCL